MKIFKIIRELFLGKDKDDYVPEEEDPRKRLDFYLSDLEYDRIQEFFETHKKSCPSHSTIGGKYTYHITPTGLGNVIEIECGCCGTKLDITDIDSW